MESATKKILAQCIKFLESTLGNMSAKDADSTVRSVVIILKALTEDESGIPDLNEQVKYPQVKVCTTT